MPSSKTKSAVSNDTGKGKNAKDAPRPAANASSTPPSSGAANQDTSEPTPTSGSGKPDKAAYEIEQEKIKSEIDALQLKLSAVKDKISLTTKSGPGNDRRTALRTELDGLRAQQSEIKITRGRILDQLKAIQENMQKKSKDLQNARSKTTFKTVDEVDAYIKNLEKQVESGTMIVVEEKRALQEISQCKRTRRVIESYRTDQESLETDRAAADELRKQLEDPQSKAISERYEAIKSELDELKKEGDEAYAGRSKLFEERDALQEQLNALFNRKRQSTQAFRDANDRYWNKVNEERMRRAERQRAQRAAGESEKRREAAERLREEAALPAFQAQIEDCQTLIDFFSGKNSGNAPAPLSAKADVAGVPKLELRKVEAGPADGLVVRKKKTEDEDSYFVGKGKTKGGKKGGAKGGESSADPATSNAQLNVPLPTLSALLALSIPPPTSGTDVPRVVGDLKTKKAWFEANQSRVTAENVAKAEAEVRRLIDSTKSDIKPDASPAIGENQGEPVISEVSR